MRLDPQLDDGLAPQLEEAAKAAKKILENERNARGANLTRWAVCLAHWGKVMAAAYTLRATPQDRQTFRENIKWYVSLKSQIHAGGCCWYDWQCFSVLTTLFDKFESLMAISQEGMEACQKRNNMLMRLGCNFSSARQVPWKVLKAGREAVKAHLEEKKKANKTPAEWLCKRNLFSFFSNWWDVFARVEHYKATGRTMDWKTQFSPEWVSCICLTKIYTKLCARRRFDKAVRVRARVVEWSRCEDGRGFKVKEYDERRAQLVEELRVYYAPVPCQSGGAFGEFSPALQRKLIQRERVQRWAKRTKSQLWVAITHNTGVF